METISMHQMRDYVFNAYAGKKWHERVLKMPNNQIVAIYKSLIKREALPEVPKPKEELFHQMDIWEYMLSMKGNK